VRALINHYSTLYEALHDKLNTYGCTLLWDLDRYISLCGFSELRLFFIKLRKAGLAYEDILEEMRAHYAVEYSPNYLVSVVSTEIPNKIAKTAKMLRMENETPEDQRKTCIHCKRSLPANPLFYSRNNSHKDGLSNTCKDCDRKSRIRRGVISGGDLRKKDPTLSKV
jgi:RNase P subunit RPR2